LALPFRVEAVVVVDVAAMVFTRGIRMLAPVRGLPHPHRRNQERGKEPTGRGKKTGWLPPAKDHFTSIFSKIAANFFY